MAPVIARCCIVCYTDSPASAHPPVSVMIENLVIFVLAALLGTEVLTKVPQTLHTPLMSGANAISGITIVGALIAAGMSDAWWATALGFGALVVATINVVGGFLVTDRMLRMFGRKRSASSSDAPSS